MIRVVSNRAEKLLCDLIAIRTVNPMGGPSTQSAPIERPVIEYLEQIFEPYDVELRRLPCGPLHESLLVSVPGHSNVAGVLLESHIDTVPADDWVERAFVPRLNEGRVYGRGACDDKGALAAMALAVLDVLESGQRPPQPVWLLAAGDEEHGQSGIRHFLKNTQLEIACGVFGEPTQLIPVVQHKGTIRWDITARGRSAHTSRSELGHNAILDMVQVIEAVAEYELRLRAGYSCAMTGAPSLTVTMIEGGRTRNMVPDQCKVALDFRIVPNMDAHQAVADLLEHLNNRGLRIEHGEFQCFAPALNTSPQDPFVMLVTTFCERELSRPVAPAGAPYGSDAGWMPRSIPTIVLGPGNIAQAHAVDEYVELKQVEQAAAIYRGIISHNWRTKGLEE